jgi:hypothetical protein
MDIGTKDVTRLIIIKLTYICQSSFKFCKASTKMKLWDQNKLKSFDVGCQNFAWQRIFKSTFKVKHFNNSENNTLTCKVIWCDDDHEESL